MFWRRRERETLGERTKVSGPLADPPQDLAARPLSETIELEQGASRAASISRIAEELGRRGEEVVELFKEVVSSAGRVVLPIHLRRGEENVFVEVENGPWERKTVEGVIRSVAVLRGSEYSDSTFEVLGARPVPYEVHFFCGRSPAALFQLDLVRRDDPEYAEGCAEGFRNAAKRYWDRDLDYDPEELPVIEELLLSVLGERTEGGVRVPVLDALVRCYGCYAGEVLRRRTAQGSWRSAADWGERFVLEFPDVVADPVGKARAFLENGPEDSVAYYVSYAIEELNASSEEINDPSPSSES
jgi:hypothetical protein